jgi:hypothetical protein
MTKMEIMMAKLVSENFERFGHAITPQRRRGALPKVVQGGGLRLVHVSPISKAQKKDSLKGELPSDDSYLLAQDSESSSLPPLQEDNEALAMLQEPLR